MVSTHVGGVRVGGGEEGNRVLLEAPSSTHPKLHERVAYRLRSKR